MLAERHYEEEASARRIADLQDGREHSGEPAKDVGNRDGTEIETGYLANGREHCAPRDTDDNVD